MRWGLHLRFESTPVCTPCSFFKKNNSLTSGIVSATVCMHSFTAAKTIRSAKTAMSQCPSRTTHDTKYTKLSSLNFNFLQFWTFPSNHHTFPGHELVAWILGTVKLQDPLWSNDINGNSIPTKQREFGRPNSAILIAGGTWWQTPIADGKFEENPMLLRTTEIQTLYQSGYTVFSTKDTQTTHTGKSLPVEKEEFTAGDGSDNLTWPSMGWSAANKKLIFFRCPTRIFLRNVNTRYIIHTMFFFNLSS